MKETLEKIGFKEFNSYKHDLWNTVVMKKGHIQVDLTTPLSGGETEVSAYLGEVESIEEIKVSEIKLLDKIINK